MSDGTCPPRSTTHDVVFASLEVDSPKFEVSVKSSVARESMLDNEASPPTSEVPDSGPLDSVVVVVACAEESLVAPSLVIPGVAPVAKVPVVVGLLVRAPVEVVVTFGGAVVGAPLVVTAEVVPSAG